MSFAFATLNAGQIADGLVTRRIGRRIFVFDEIDSTNSYCLRELATRQGYAADGFTLFAEYQSAGRGRLGRSWQSPRGASLTFSILLFERPEEFSPTRLVMGAAVAVVDAIAEVTDVEPTIRWPNDVYVGSRKLAGILVEAKASGPEPVAVAIGIGVNCLQQPGHWPEELREKATSLEIESRQPVDRIAVARAILQKLDEQLGPGAPDDAALAAAWKDRSADLGQRICLQFEGQLFCGHVLDVNPRGGLLVQLDDGGRRQFDPATVMRTP